MVAGLQSISKYDFYTSVPVRLVNFIGSDEIWRQPGPTDEIVLRAACVGHKQKEICLQQNSSCKIFNDIRIFSRRKQQQQQQACTRSQHERSLR
jgi:hypothetical protein